MGTWDWDIIGITETWLREGQDWQLNVPGYRYYRKDRTGGKRGGGVAFLILENSTAVLKWENSEGLLTEKYRVELRNKKGRSQ